MVAGLLDERRAVRLVGRLAERALDARLDGHDDLLLVDEVVAAVAAVHGLQPGSGGPGNSAGVVQASQSALFHRTMAAFAQPLLNGKRLRKHRVWTMQTYMQPHHLAPSTCTTSGRVQQPEPATLRGRYPATGAAGTGAGAAASGGTGTDEQACPP